MIPSNPADNTSLPRIVINEIQPLNDDELHRLMEVAKDYRLYHALILLIGTGIRRGELLGLKWQDINFGNNTIAISRSYVKTNIGDVMNEPKTQAGIRVINVPILVMQLLWEYKSTLPENAVMVVSQLNSDKPISPRNFSRIFAGWCEKANLETNRVHDLRHIYASQLMALNVPMKMAQAQLGHSDIKTTMRYSHFMDGMQQEAANKLNNKLDSIMKLTKENSNQI